jgi:hypothetical protein
VVLISLLIGSCLFPDTLLADKNNALQNAGCKDDGTPIETTVAKSDEDIVRDLLQHQNFQGILTLVHSKPDPLDRFVILRAIVRNDETRQFPYIVEIVKSLDGSEHYILGLSLEAEFFKSSDIFSNVESEIASGSYRRQILPDLLYRKLIAINEARAGFTKRAITMALTVGHDMNGNEALWRVVEAAGATFDREDIERTIGNLVDEPVGALDSKLMILSYFGRFNDALASIHLWIEGGRRAGVRWDIDEFITPIILGASIAKRYREINELINEKTELKDDKRLYLIIMAASAYALKQTLELKYVESLMDPSVLRFYEMMESLIPQEKANNSHDCKKIARFIAACEENFRTFGEFGAYIRKHVKSATCTIK